MKNIMNIAKALTLITFIGLMAGCSGEHNEGGPGEVKEHGHSHD